MFAFFLGAALLTDGSDPGLPGFGFTVLGLVVTLVSIAEHRTRKRKRAIVKHGISAKATVVSCHERQKKFDTPHGRGSVTLYEITLAVVRRQGFGAKGGLN